MSVRVCYICLTRFRTLSLRSQLSYCPLLCDSAVLVDSLRSTSSLHLCTMAAMKAMRAMKAMKAMKKAMKAKAKPKTKKGKLVAAKTKQIDALTKDVDDKTARVGDDGVKLSEMKEDLEDTEALEEDKKFLTELDKSCATKQARQTDLLSRQRHENSEAERNLAVDLVKLKDHCPLVFLSELYL